MYFISTTVNLQMKDNKTVFTTPQRHTKCGQSIIIANTGRRLNL